MTNLNEFQINDFIKNLIKNQNDTDYNYFKNLYTFDNYYQLFNDVLNIINTMPNASLEEYRNILYKNSNIEKLMKYFIYDKKFIPGLVVNFGTKDYSETIVCGNKQEVVLKDNRFFYEKEKMNHDTIFDLASTSKLFTTVSILKLCEKGIINLEDSITKYVPQFKGLENTTIYELMTFVKGVKTTERIDAQKNKDDALKALETIYIDPNSNKYFAYTDIGVMTLRLLIEKVTNMPFLNFLQEEIFNPLHMNNTFLNVPKDLIENVANENYSSIVNKDGKIVTTYDTYKGTVHDPKARVIGQSDGIAPGHAGLFSNAEDISKFAKSFMNNDLINKTNVKLIGTSKNGIFDEEIQKYNCHLGMLNFSKQLNSDFRTVPHFLSGCAFLQPGYAGTSLCVDSKNEVYSFIAGNRLHNRIHSVNPLYKDKIINLNGINIYTNEDDIKIVSQTYREDIEKLTDAALKLALQYKFLDKIFENTNVKSKDTSKKLIREI